MTGLAIVIFAELFFLAETAYFGWNWEPQSEAEHKADKIGAAIMYFGGIVFVIELNWVSIQKIFT